MFDKQLVLDIKLFLHQPDSVCYVWNLVCLFIIHRTFVQSRRKNPPYPPVGGASRMLRGLLMLRRRAVLGTPKCEKSVGRRMHYPNLYPIWAYLFTEVVFKYLRWCIYIEQ